MTAPIREMSFFHGPAFGHDVPLSRRTKNCVENAWRSAGWTLELSAENISKLLTVGDLKSQPNFGNKSLAELREWLDFYGFELSAVPVGERLKVEMEERAELARLKAKYE